MKLIWGLVQIVVIFGVAAFILVVLKLSPNKGKLLHKLEANFLQDP